MLVPQGVGMLRHLLNLLELEAFILTDDSVDLRVEKLLAFIDFDVISNIFG